MARSNAVQKASPISETGYKQIRSDIIFGRLVPAQKLKLDPLRDRYNVSVTTLREILNRLASEGLVVAEGQRGFEVAPISPADLQELAALRILLECHAIGLAFAGGDMEWEGHVVSAHYKLSQIEQKMKAGVDVVRELWKRYDSEFHQALISACGSRQLMNAHLTVFNKYLRYQMLTLTYRGDVAAGEHQQLLDAALARDTVAAQRVLRKHIDGGVAHALHSDAFASGVD